ncbi:RhsIA family immunity protein [Shewanella profunda]|uniref:NTF2 fold immunity protein n=1 Tax=Shewanella profunda TaxID=254793 RepID=UPI00200E3210|nr:NTF2 fold immunity protein [Shewanella profunda]MCL1088572.1 RhsIA family immunity protein [Shewanella profunda]
MDDLELKEYLTQRILSFCDRWNVIENNIRTQHDAEEDTLKREFPEQEYHYAKRTDWFAILSERISPLFDEFCTEKRRVYGGKVRKSFGYPSKFNGCGEPLEVHVELKIKSRAEIYIKTNTSFDDEYLFVALKKSGDWLIDSYKKRRYGNEKWDLQIL